MVALTPAFVVRGSDSEDSIKLSLTGTSGPMISIFDLETKQPIKAITYVI